MGVHPSELTFFGGTMKYLIFLFLAFGAFAQAENTVPFASDCPFPDSVQRPTPGGNTDYSYSVAPDGTLHDVKITRPSANPALDQAGAECIAHWHVTNDPVWQGMIASKTIDIFWDRYAAKPVGRASAGRPHTCFDYYPAAEKSARISGTSTVGFRILETGSTADPRIVVSSGNANLDNAALTCVRNWHYVPAVKDGKPVAVDWQAQVRWAAP